MSKKYVRPLPHIPFADNFWAFAETGKQLAHLHLNYETVPEYTGLTLKETPNLPLNWRVEAMALSKTKTEIRYNDFLTIENIPAEAHAYRLGTRSALEWIVNQYKVKVDKGRRGSPGSGIVNDPNREEAPGYIVALIGRIVTVSLDTVALIDSLPPLND